MHIEGAQTELIGQLNIDPVMSIHKAVAEI